MVLPDAVDAEIAPGQALTAKPALLQHPNGRRIAGNAGGFNAMKNRAVFAVWAGGWGASATLAEATLVGLATWLLGVLIAGRLALAGHRGPAELVVRRLTYPRTRA